MSDACLSVQYRPSRCKYPYNVQNIRQCYEQVVTQKLRGLYLLIQCSKFTRVPSIEKGFVRVGNDLDQTKMMAQDDTASW